MTTLNIASHAPREKHLQTVLAACLKQRTKPDLINVYLNGYTKRPKWIPKEVNCEFGEDYGASAKFYFAAKQKSGIYITLDDDLIPDRGYVGYMADMAMRYPNCLVGLHGTTYGRHPVQSYYSDQTRVVHYCYHGTSEHRFVDMLGTGALAFRVGLGLNQMHFPVNNMTDPHLCKWAKDSGTPMLCIQRAAGFVREITAAQDVAIWKGVANNDSKQTAVINSAINFTRKTAQPYNVAALDDGCLEWGHMKIIANSVRSGDKFIELGSGASTAYWHKCRLNVEAWDHHKGWAAKTGATHYPLKSGWYDTDRKFDCDVLLVDGPIGSTGERYNLPLDRITDRIRTIFVDDCHRYKDMELAQQIAQHTGKKLHLHRGVVKVLAEIR